MCDFCCKFAPDLCNNENSIGYSARGGGNNLALRGRDFSQGPLLPLATYSSE